MNRHAWFDARPQQMIGLGILRKTIAVVIVFRIASEIRFAGYLWGDESISKSNSSSAYFGSVIGNFFDSVFFSSLGIYALLGLMFMSALMVFQGFFTRIATFILLLFVLMLEARCPQLNDGGDNIMRLTLIYLLLTTSKPNLERTNFFNQIKIRLHNLGVAAIVAQLMILYWTSGFLKISGESWQNGTALYSVSNIEWFSNSFFKILLSNPILTTMLTYTTMVFQILFPIAIFSKLKIPWILLGIPMHVGIGYFMGLITFSSIMIALELFLITDSEYNKFFERTMVLKSGIQILIHRKSPK